MVYRFSARLVGITIVLLLILGEFNGSSPESWRRGQGVMLRYSLSLTPAVSWAALDPDGRSLAATVLMYDSVSDRRQGRLQIWDVQEQRIVAEKALVQAPISAHLQDPRFVQYSLDGRHIVLYDGEAVLLLEAPSLRELGKVNLGLPLPRLAKGVEVTAVTATEVSPDGRRAALMISEGPFSGGKLEILDFQSGRVAQEWKFNSGVGLSGGASVAWSPEGQKLALTLVSVFPGEKLPKDSKNLLILDAQTGRVLARINTGYVAGPVAFASEDIVITCSLNPDPKFYSADTLRIWNAATGQLLREIGNPPEGVHFQLGVSRDGRKVLGYTGLEKYDPELHANFAVYRQFRLWDLATGTVLATSDQFQPPAILAGWARGKPSATSEGLRLSLSGRGNRVLVWWRFTARPLLIYQVE